MNDQPPAPSPQQWPPPAPKTGWSKKKKAAAWIGGIITALTLIGLIVEEEPTPEVEAIAAPAPASAQAQAQATTTVKPTTTEQATTIEPAATEPVLSVTEQQAIKQAKSYLDYSAFSRTGLIEQLEYEEFPTAAATMAVDSLDVDWFAQAVEQGRSYLDYSAFSHGSLIGQLEHEGFTTDQATQAADILFAG